MSFGWLLESFQRNADPASGVINPTSPQRASGLDAGAIVSTADAASMQQLANRTASAPPEYNMSNDSVSSPDGEVSHRDSINQLIDHEDEDDKENVMANEVAITTPRQVMRLEFYKMSQLSRGRVLSTAGTIGLFEGTPDELEKGENYFKTMLKGMPPLMFEFVGCFFLGLV